MDEERNEKLLKPISHLTRDEFVKRFIEFLDWFESGIVKCNSACPAAPGFLVKNLGLMVGDTTDDIPDDIHQLCHFLAGTSITSTFEPEHEGCPCDQAMSKSDAIHKAQLTLARLEKEGKLWE
jgi:hypothetical protein